MVWRPVLVPRFDLAVGPDRAGAMLKTLPAEVVEEVLAKLAALLGEGPGPSS